MVTYDYEGMSHRKTPTRTAAGRRYPTYLVVGFASGLVIFGVGAALLLLALFSGLDTVKLISAVFLVVGSVTAVMALLRGQDLNERNAQ